MRNRTGEDQETGRPPERPRDETPRGADDVKVAGDRTAATGTSVTERLIEADRARRLRERWHEVQAGFVDDPEAAVRGAEDLTGEVFTALAEALESRKKAVRDIWKGGTDDADTERLRQALRGYRDLVRQVIGA